jgi:hypothetical protein
MHLTLTGLACGKIDEGRIPKKQKEKRHAQMGRIMLQGNARYQLETIKIFITSDRTNPFCHQEWDSSI